MDLATLKRQIEVQDVITEADIKKMVRCCMNHLKLKKYELGLTKAHVDRAVRVTRAKNTHMARAGAFSIYIGLKPWQYYRPTKSGKEVYEEYPAFNADKVIGQIRTETLRNMMWVRVAHEVSHHVQYARGPYIRRFKDTYRKPHGRCFQDIYRYLRKDLINPMITLDNLSQDI